MEIFVLLSPVKSLQNSPPDSSHHPWTEENRSLPPRQHVFENLSPPAEAVERKNYDVRQIPIDLLLLWMFSHTKKSVSYFNSFLKHIFRNLAI